MPLLESCSSPFPVHRPVTITTLSDTHDMAVQHPRFSSQGKSLSSSPRCCPRSRIWPESSGPGVSSIYRDALSISRAPFAFERSVAGEWQLFSSGAGRKDDAEDEDVAGMALPLAKSVLREQAAHGFDSALLCHSTAPEALSTRAHAAALRNNSQRCAGHHVLSARTE